MATGAVRLMSAWARGALGLTAIRLRTARDNERSQRVAERSGFRRMMASLDAGPADEERAEDVVFELPDVQPGLRT
jgi:RimJ/RimL family protein N-acetyltransferase